MTRGKTLAEKRYGAGIRPGTTAATTPTDLSVCRVLDCSAPPVGSVELWVDDHPPALDWYTRVMAGLPLQQYTRVAFCAAHMSEVNRRSMDELSEPDTWAPWRDNPVVLPRPPKIWVPGEDPT